MTPHPDRELDGKAIAARLFSIDGEYNDLLSFDNEIKGLIEDIRNNNHDLMKSVCPYVDPLSCRHVQKMLKSGVRICEQESASHTAAKSEREVLVNLIDWMKDTIDLIDVRRNAGRYVSPTEEGMRITLLEVIEKYDELRHQPREQRP